MPSKAKGPARRFREALQAAGLAPSQKEFEALLVESGTSISYVRRERVKMLEVVLPIFWGALSGVSYALEYLG